LRRSSTRSSSLAWLLLALILAALPTTASAQNQTEIQARLDRAKAAVDAGERSIALGIYSELSESYRRDGDLVSADFVNGEAARVLLELDRPDDAARLLLSSRVHDPVPGQRANRDHLIVIALERAGRREEARAMLEAARRTTPHDTWAWQLRDDAIRLGVPDRPRRWSSVAWTLLALAIGFVAAFALWRARRNEIAIAGVALFVTVGAAEGVLRLVVPAPTDVRHILHPPSRTTVFRPEKGVMPGVEYAESHFTVDAAGLRSGPLPAPGVMRVLAIGGSTTEALYLDDHDAWTAVLERELGRRLARPVWVGNAGKSGLTSFAHVTQALAYVDDIKPDVVIVQAGINDLTMCVSGDRRDLVETAFRFRWPDAWDAYGRRIFAEVNSPGAGRGLRLQTMVDRVVMRFSAPEPAGGAGAAVVQDRQASYYRVLRAARAGAQKIDSDPDLAPCLIAFDDNLHRIAGIVLPLGIRLVLVTQGSLYRNPMPADDESLLWFGSVEQSVFAHPPAPQYYSAASMQRALAKYNAITLRLCEERKLVCVDADALLPHSTAIYYDDVHFNIGGARRLGEALAVAIAKAP
jgi:lysophospholipase L1-like esterase